MKRLSFLILSICIMLQVPTFACTGFYVGKEVSDNGTTIIARTRDSNNMQKVASRVFNKRIENKKNRVYNEAWLLETYTGHEWAAVKMPLFMNQIKKSDFLI